MSHFAELDQNNIVLRVIVADTKEWCEQNLGGTWVQTSYNTMLGEHKLGGEPLYKNFAGIGYHFNGIGFYAPQPYPSWLFDSFKYEWYPPTPKPEKEEGYIWDWNEETLSWVKTKIQ